MFLLFKPEKKGLSHGLIKVHQFLLEDIISYFEKGKSTKRRIREIRNNLRQAVRFARKKKIYPSLKTNRAVDIFEEMYEELELTHKVIKETAKEMESMIKQIKEERVIGTHSIVMEAQEYFKEKEIDTGIKLLQKAQNELNGKLLYKTRKKVLAGYDSEVKKIKYEIEENKTSVKNRKKTKFLTFNTPFNEFFSYKLAMNCFNKFSELIN